MNELPLNQVLCGDCVEVLKDFPDNSIDLVVTDPPYGLSFMGKDWDKALPSREAFTEIIRVLKPGALAFVMSSPRQDLLWRMLALLEGVGFELTQSYIDWIYKTGFPKAYDVSLGFDRRLITKEFIEENGRKPTKDELKELLKEKRQIISINEEFRSKVKAEVKRGQMNINKNRQLMGLTDSEAGYQNPDQIGLITQPYSNLGKKWNGWKSLTGMKPAHEPILMVNKPFSESTIVDNVLKWGTGAINVDSCRIPFQNEIDPRLENEIPRKGGFSSNSEIYHNDPKYGIDSYPSKGRFPANLLVSDRALDTDELSKSGTLAPHHKILGDGNGNKSGEIYGTFTRVPAENHITYGDLGDQSRYFDLDAWAEHHGFLDVPKPDNKERDYGLKGKKSIPTSKLNLSDGKNPVRLNGAIPNPRRNTHPTVKPIKLMAYLIELGCPPDGVVLDPFVGSGTTCIAAKKLVRKYVGIEINPEYVALAQARIRAYPIPFDWFNESVADPPNSRSESNG